MSDTIRPAAGEALRAERSRLLAEVNEMASDPDRQDELAAVMRDVRRIDRRLSELSEAEHQRELEAIVRDLATSEEPMTDHPTGLMLRCKVCGGVTQETGVLRHHLDTCAWRLGFPQATTEDLARSPYDEDGYCEFCGNGHWKHHAPWCTWQDLVDAEARPVSGDQQ